MLKMIGAGKYFHVRRQRDQKDWNRLEMGKRGEVRAE